MTLLADDFNNDVQRGEVGESSPLQPAFRPSTSAVTFVSQQLPFGSGNTKCAECCGIVKLPHTNRECSSRGWIPRLWVSRRRTNSTTLTSVYTCSTFALRGPKATDVATEAALRRNQDPGAEMSRDFSLFFCCLSAVCQSSPNCVRVFRMLISRMTFPRVISATIDITICCPTCVLHLMSLVRFFPIRVKVRQHEFTYLTIFSVTMLQSF